MVVIDDIIPPEPERPDWLPRANDYWKLEGISHSRRLRQYADDYERAHVYLRWDHVDKVRSESLLEELILTVGCVVRQVLYHGSGLQAQFGSRRLRLPLVP